MAGISRWPYLRAGIARVYCIITVSAWVNSLVYVVWVRGWYIITRAYKRSKRACNSLLVQRASKNCIRSAICYLYFSISIFRYYCAFPVTFLRPQSFARGLLHALFSYTPLVDQFLSCVITPTYHPLLNEHVRMCVWGGCVCREGWVCVCREGVCVCVWERYVCVGRCLNCLQVYCRQSVIIYVIIINS